MKRNFLQLMTLLILTFAFSNAFTAQAQVRAYRVNDNQLRNLLNRLETRTDNFRRSFDRSFDNSGRNGTRLEQQLTQYVTDFENATDSLKRNFEERDSTQYDAQEVLNRALVINEFMRTNRVSVAAQNQWNLIRSDLNMLANYYNVRWTWTGAVVTNPVGGNRPYYVNDSQVQSLLTRIEQRTDTFRRNLDRSTNNSTVEQYVGDFERATDSLKRNFDQRNSVAGDVEEVLRRASVIDAYIRNSRYSAATERNWTLLRSDLNTLAQYYRVSWNWNNPSQYPSYGGFDARLTGTYRLNIRQSDNVTNIVDRAISSGNYNANQSDRVRRNLERRLTPPDTLVLSKNGMEVMLGSNLSQQVTFSADNVTRYETTNNNRRMGIRASATGNDLTINYEGDRMNDFNVTFTPLANGQLRVSRRLYLENRNTTVTLNSIYDKVDQVARWDSVNAGGWNNTTGSTTTSGDFIIPNNTRLTAVLTTPISTKTSRDGDSFRMEVTSPAQYRGAIIEGSVVGERSGVVSGRANLSFNLNTIRMPNGTTYRFAGIVDQVVQPNGDRVSVNNEGTVRDSNQTTKTVTRAGIGAALGAIIGAIAGGGQGAAVGAAIGAGAGAGTVILQGRDNIELQNGTEFTITASAPANVSQYR